MIFLGFSSSLLSEFLHNKLEARRGLAGMRRVKSRVPEEGGERTLSVLKEGRARWAGSCGGAGGAGGDRQR